MLRVVSLLLLSLIYVIVGGDAVIISRSEWGARSPKSTKNLGQNPAPFVVIHHSDGSTCETSQSCKVRVKGIQNYHMDTKKWEDIGYNFLIGGDGQVYEGRGWGIWGAHSPKYNSKSIGICVIGNFMTRVPSTQQLNALRDLIDFAKRNNYITSNYHLLGHRQGSKTSCPGNQLFNEIRTWPQFDSSIPTV